MIHRLDVAEWDYLAEGNLHLLLKYIGDDKIYVGKVLRISKIDAQG